MNSFRKVITVLYPLVNFPPTLDIGHAHNEFFQAALDLGIPGLIAFIAVYIASFWMLIRIWQIHHVNLQRTTRKQPATIPITQSGGWLLGGYIPSLLDKHLIKMAVLGLGGGLLAHMLWGMTDAMALGARPAFLFWVILGLICGLHQQVQAYLATGDAKGSEPDPLNIQ